MDPEIKPEAVDQLLQTPDLASALENDQFKQFLDHVPVAIAVSALKPNERVIYANLEFERLTGMPAGKVIGSSWEVLEGPESTAQPSTLGTAIISDADYIGQFALQGVGGVTDVDAWANVIEADSGAPEFRLVALAATDRKGTDTTEAIEEKDVLLRELQHRVKNNLQMITALIRFEARSVTADTAGEKFSRLAGRVEALGILYHALTEAAPQDAVDLGIYLSQIASAVMHAHGVEGIHLDLQLDTWPVSLDVAMPAGLVVNELLTNALKHAFHGRDGGAITLHCLASDRGCTVVVADDGVGLPEGATWPNPGKLSSLIVRSLVQNAKADVQVDSSPGKGMRVTIHFTRKDAAPV